MKSKIQHITLSILFLMLCVYNTPSMAQTQEEPVSTTTQTQSIEKGYRGFAEWSNNFWAIYYIVPMTHTGLSTTHGYQFNPNFFAGVGAEFTAGWPLPFRSKTFFFNVRTDNDWRKLHPYADLRLGYTDSNELQDKGWLYISPTVGLRFPWTKRCGFNIGLGMTLRGYTRDKGSMIQNEDDTYTPSGKSYHFNPMVALRLGVDF